MFSFTTNYVKLLAVLSLICCCEKINAQCTIKTAVNVSEMSDASCDWPFANLMKVAGAWKTALVGTDLNQLNDLSALQNSNIDANGYVKQVPFNTNGSDYFVYNEFKNTNSLPLGIYSVIWEGTGSITVNGSFEVLSTNGNTINFRINRSLGNVGRLIINSSSQSNNVKNIRVLLPGTQATYLINPFNPGWTSKMSAFRIVRFENWIGENFNGNTVWSQRASNDNYSFNIKGVPMETIVKFCNDYQHDAWINVPYNASDDYIRSMAQYLKVNLNITRNVYVEFAKGLNNENSIQTQYLRNNLPNTWPSNLGVKVNSVMTIFKEVFAAQPQRLKTVFDVDKNNIAFAQNVLQQVSSGNINIISTKCGIRNTSNNLNTVTEITNDLNNYIDNSLASEISNVKNLASNLQLEFHISEAKVNLNGVQSSLVESLQVSNEYATTLNKFIDKIYEINYAQNYIYACSKLCNNAEMNGEIGLINTLNVFTPYNLNAPGYYALSQYNNCLLSGVEDNQIAKNNLNIYPNPNNGLFKISLPFDLNLFKNPSIQIIDGKGALVTTVDIREEGDLNLTTNLNPGIYLVQLSSAKEHLFSKLIITQ